MKLVTTAPILLLALLVAQPAAIDADGTIVDRHEGQAGRERFAEMMEKALGD